MLWLSWDKLCKPKVFGGMGFRSFSDFNKALLAKQLWRIIQYPDSLLSRVLKGRYFKNDDVMNARLGCNPSYIWRSLLWRRFATKRAMLESWQRSKNFSWF